MKIGYLLAVSYKTSKIQLVIRDSCCCCCFGVSKDNVIQQTRGKRISNIFSF